MRKAKIFTNNKGDDFYVRIITQGERYGADVEFARGKDILTAFDSAAVWDNTEPGVIFYDFEYACTGRFGPYGQQIASYYIETILEDGQSGLNLMGGEPKWQIDADTMDEVRAFLRSYEK